MCGRLPVEHGGQVLALTFGAPQGADVRPIRDDVTGTGKPLNHQAVANYIAKYATKTLTAPGLPSCRIRTEADLGHLRCSAHYRRMITTAWQLGGTRDTARCRAWAHMLGYGGHFLTKSRRYSATFGQLRQARTDHRRAARPLGADRDAWGRPLDETVVLVLPTIWTYAGTGQRQASFPSRAPPIVGTCRCATSCAAGRSRESDYQIKWPHEDHDRNRGITALLRSARCR